MLRVKLSSSYRKGKRLNSEIVAVDEEKAKVLVAEGNASYVDEPEAEVEEKPVEKTRKPRTRRSKKTYRTK